jgi:outer membrane protein assembly factor BamB
VPIAGALLFAASQMGVFLISPLGGEMIDGIHMADGSAMTPAAAGNRAFVLTNGGTLLSLKVSPPYAALTPNRYPPPAHP